MRDVLLYFSNYFKGDWDDIYKAIESKKRIEENNLKTLVKLFKNENYITLIDKNYPEYLKNIFKPPFVVYLEGNKSLLNNTKRLCLADKEIDKEIIREIALKLWDYTFFVDVNNEKLINELIKYNLKIIAVSQTKILDIKRKKIFKEIIKSNNLIISESPPIKGKKISKIYFERFICGLSQQILFTNKITNDYEYFVKISYCENFSIFSLIDSKYNNEYDVVKISNLNQINKFKK